jgi:hypothetical protein
MKFNCMKKLFYLFAGMVLSVGSMAQSPVSMNASEIILGLEKLNTVGAVLYIAAHPDDENTRLLGYLSKERKLRTGYLSVTRGDGGQNLIGKEQGDALQPAGQMGPNSFLHGPMILDIPKTRKKHFRFGTETVSWQIWSGRYAGLSPMSSSAVSRQPAKEDMDITLLRLFWLSKHLMQQLTRSDFPISWL